MLSRRPDAFRRWIREAAVSCSVAERLPADRPGEAELGGRLNLLRRGLQGAAGATKVRELLDAFVGMAGTLPGAKSASAGGGDGVFNANGAPALQPPPQSFSANDMIDLLRSIRSKSDEAQVASAKESLSVARTKMEKNNEAQLQKIQDYVKKCEEADRKGVLGKIFGWIGKIAALVFSFFLALQLNAIWLGSFLSANWTQYPKEYSAMIGYLNAFAMYTATSALAVVFALMVRRRQT